MSQGLAARRQIAIRPAVREDTETIAALSAQLGYPSAAERVRSRLESLLHASFVASTCGSVPKVAAALRRHLPGRGKLAPTDPDDAVWVAETAEARVIGWVHVSVRRLVESDPEAEIGGLIVDEEHRGSGAGRLLMERAEQWARAKGLPSVYLRSNVVRQAAHAFYRKLGYQVVKTQHAFRKFI